MAPSLLFTRRYFFFFLEDIFLENIFFFLVFWNAAIRLASVVGEDPPLKMMQVMERDKSCYGERQIMLWRETNKVKNRTK